MLDNRPILKDRLKAFAVFTGIAIGGVAGLELVISGGFDPITPGALAAAPSDYDGDTVMRAWHYQPYTHDTAAVTPTAYLTGYPIETTDTDFSVDADLSGGDEDDGARSTYIVAQSEDELMREIERIYAASPDGVVESETDYASDDAEFVEAVEQYQPDAQPVEVTKH